MKLAAVFSDYMVLQRGISVPVWGSAKPGEEITVTFAGQAKAGRAGDDGRWEVRLEPLEVSVDPETLTIESGGGERIEMADVLVGDVWLASGQSNMWWRVLESNDAEAETAAADHPLIRLFNVPQAIDHPPHADVDAAWAVCSPETVPEFSAVAYFFGRELQKSEGIPIGLINTSWGGTRVEAWISRDALMTDELCAQDVAGYERMLGSLDESARQKDFDTFKENPTEWYRTHVAPDPGNEGYGRGWADPALDDGEWPEMEIPGYWQADGIESNGVVWFRRTVKVPAAWEGKDVVLHLGTCDKHDVTYFNNKEVGVTSWETENPWSVKREYRIPGELVRAGANTLAVRVYSYRNLGGLGGPAGEMRLVPEEGGEDAVELPGVWRYQIEHNFGTVNDRGGDPEPLPNQNSPYCLYDNMIVPLVPFALRGVIWYQGESNAENAYRYRTRFPMLIENWRDAWGQGEFPFLFVQLANYTQHQKEPQDSPWAELREAQTMTLSVPHTAMAVTIDIGDAMDIHPTNKQDVGKRLALAALGTVYGRDVVPSGPMYRSHTIEGASVRIEFDHVGGGLEALGGALTGFTIAGSDRRFVWADAEIDGDTVLVSSSEVGEPAAVRCAWAANPDCNLYNRAGLPASPFRTDDWPGVTQHGD